jgi:hypothetical protein
MGRDADFDPLRFGRGPGDPSADAFAERFAGSYRRLRAVEESQDSTIGDPWDGSAPVEPDPEGWRARTRRSLVLASVLAVALVPALLLGALVWSLTGTPAPSWWSPLPVYALLAASVAFATLGSRLMAPARRRSAVLGLTSAPGPVPSKPMQGAYPLHLIQVRDARGVCAFSVDGSPIVVGRIEAGIGGGDMWHLHVGLVRGRIEGTSDRPLATARRRATSPRRWRVTDGSQSYELRVSAARSREALWPWKRVRRFRHGRVIVDGAGDRHAGLVILYFHTEEDRQRLDDYVEGETTFQGLIELEEAVPLPVVVLMLRITLGPWSARPPFVTTWRRYPSSTA